MPELFHLRDSDSFLWVECSSLATHVAHPLTCFDLSSNITCSLRLLCPEPHPPFSYLGTSCPPFILLISLFSFFFFSICHHLTLSLFTCFVYCLSILLEYKLHEGKNLSLFYFYLSKNTDCFKECLVHYRCVINTF